VNICNSLNVITARIWETMPKPLYRAWDCRVFCGCMKIAAN